MCSQLYRFLPGFSPYFRCFLRKLYLMLLCANVQENQKTHGLTEWLPFVQNRAQTP